MKSPTEAAASARTFLGISSVHWSNFRSRNNRALLLTVATGAHVQAIVVVVALLLCVLTPRVSMAACPQQFPSVIAPVPPPDLTLMVDPNNTNPSTRIDAIDVVYGYDPTGPGNCGIVAYVNVYGVGSTIVDSSFYTQPYVPPTQFDWPGQPHLVNHGNEINSERSAPAHLLNYLALASSAAHAPTAYPQVGALQFLTWSNEITCNRNSVASYFATCSPVLWYQMPLYLEDARVMAILPLIFQ
jgi:hypothetical protein